MGLPQKLSGSPDARPNTHLHYVSVWALQPLPQEYPQATGGFKPQRAFNPNGLSTAQFVERYNKWLVESCNNVLSLTRAAQLSQAMMGLQFAVEDGHTMQQLLLLL